MAKVWMVRAGERARFIEQFLKGIVSVGWNEIGDLTNLKTQEEILRACQKAFPNETKAQISTAVAMLYKFRSIIKQGDKIVTYNPEQREYSLGSFISDYYFNESKESEHFHQRKVEWEGKVNRDRLSVAARNSLGSVLTLFAVNEDVWAEIKKLLHSQELPFATEEIKTLEEKTELRQGFVLTRDELREKAHELSKDKIVSLADDELEELAAALLRAMGFRARVSPKGYDRGVDVFASPNGLGLEEPRIKVEVKHRRHTQMSSQDLRSFIGVLRQGDKGLYISTGGFTKDAKYELTIARAQADTIALEKFREMIYPNHPYGSILPSETVLKSYTLDQTKAFYNDNFGAVRTHLYVVGQFDAAKVKAAIEKSFGGWKKGADAIRNVPTANAKRSLTLIDRPNAPQSTIYLGMPAISPSDGDEYIKFQVLNNILGGSFGSRITSNIRENKGYTYSPFSTVFNRFKTGYWYEAADVTTQFTGASIKEILYEIERLRKEPPTEAELEGIKNYMVGIYVLQNSTRTGVINQLENLNYNELDKNYLDTYVQKIVAVTPQDVQQMASKYLSEDKMTIVVVGDKAKIAEQIKTYESKGNN